MEFETWEPLYRRILDDFGYERVCDEQARDSLAELYRSLAGANGDGGVERVVASLDFTGKTVAIAGGAPTLGDELDNVAQASAIVAASDAASVLREAGYEIDCMVTDLDKAPETARKLTAEGTPVAVHAHGDNLPAIESHVPTFEPDAVIPTTQARPVGPVRNFGGFTDGDRAAFLADERGADRLLFPGWDLDDERVTAEKRRKLTWAGRLLRVLERRREERFGVLDGRRGALDRWRETLGSEDSG